MTLYVDREKQGKASDSVIEVWWIEMYYFCIRDEDVQVLTDMNAFIVLFFLLPVKCIKPEHLSACLSGLNVLGLPSTIADKWINFIMLILLNHLVFMAQSFTLLYIVIYLLLDVTVHCYIYLPPCHEKYRLGSCSFRPVGLIVVLLC